VEIDFSLNDEKNTGKSFEVQKHEGEGEGKYDKW